MNESHTHTEISEQISALQRQVFTLLLALVVVSGTLVAFLCYQSRQLGKNIDASRQQARQIAQVYNEDLPVIQSVLKQLVAYGQAHPDFQQAVLKKYGITPQTVAALKK
jgi:predicted negative regulator of RcsB-dependent stress response